MKSLEGLEPLPVDSTYELMDNRKVLREKLKEKMDIT
jgi:hypothetical protein